MLESYYRNRKHLYSNSFKTGKTNDFLNRIGVQSLNYLHKLCVPGTFPVVKNNIQTNRNFKWKKNDSFWLVAWAINAEKNLRLVNVLYENFLFNYRDSNSECSHMNLK